MANLSTTNPPPAVLDQLANVSQALEQVRNLEESTDWLKRANAVEQVAKAAGVAHEIKVQACELRIRWERRLGEAIAESPKNPGGKPEQESYRVVGRPSKTPTLKDLEIGKSLADRARRLARIPSADFEKILQSQRSAALELETKAIDKTLSSASVLRDAKPKPEPSYSPIIKPSDNWNFSTVAYPKLNTGADGHGYIPGDIYANCLWYWTKDGDRVAAPMAGSGQIIRVWEDRETWMQGDRWDIELHCFDLSPRGPYQEQIQANDLTKGLPINDVNYIVMDVPYFGMVQGCYSDCPDDVANAESFDEWLQQMKTIARSCVASLLEGGKVTVITPNFSDVVKGAMIVVSDRVADVFKAQGLSLIHKAYASRRIQQIQNPNMARLNNQAKERRVMLTDISEVLTFAT